MQCTRMPTAYAPQNEHDRNAAEAERNIRDQPEIRVWIVAEDFLPILNDERLDDLRIRHSLALVVVNLSARGLAEMTLPRRHHAVDVLVTGAALAREVRADALHFIAFDLGLSLRPNRSRKNQEEKTKL